ncbi:ATP-binding protein (plasmid) [Streptomyces sp. JL4002]|uniref:ATP-binding protein n=1 Tax=Streptomyces sp. JL4002 TaxID=3404781 RepID=UPI003B27ED5D
MAWLGELGAGKSVGMKSAVYNVLARGHQLGWPGSCGRAVIVDRTTDQEWARFAKACPGTTQLIRIDHTAEGSLDPLRLYVKNSPQVAARFTESFLTLLLGVRPMDLEGVALSEAIQAVLSRPEPSMRALMEELTARGAADPAAQGLARKLASIARKDLARVVFDETLPVVDTQRADSVVFLVSALQLPKKSELASEHRIQRLEFEKVLGRALMYLIAAVSRETAMRSRDEFAVTVFDECWWLTSSDEGLELLLELLRDGRKRNAAAYVGSHDANDIGPADSEKGVIVRGLIPHRFVFRQTSRTLAARSLEFLGVDAADNDLLDLVTGGLSPLGLPEDQRRARAGECLYRDLAGRIGLMRVLIPTDRAIERHPHHPDRRAGGGMRTLRAPLKRLRLLGTARLRLALLVAALAATAFTMLTSIPALAEPSPSATPAPTSPPATNPLGPATPGTRTPTPEELAEIEKIVEELNKRFSDGMQEAFLKAEEERLRKLLPDEGGVLAVFNVTDERNLPISAYTVKSDTGGMWEWDLGIQNLITELCFMITKWVIAFCCWLIVWALGFGLAKLLLAPVLSVANSLHTQVILQMGLPSLFLSVCALIAVVRIFFGDRAKG